LTISPPTSSATKRRCDSVRALNAGQFPCNMIVLVYDTPLTIDQTLTRLAEQPKEIAALTDGLPRARLHRVPSRGEWSLNDVLAHLRSCSDMWGKYMATIIAEDRPTIRAMNPTTWMKSTDYPELEFAPSFRAFTKQRAQLLKLLGPLPKAAWSRSATVTGAGRPRERTVVEYAQWLANHERSHVKHIERIVGRSIRRTA
jgi:DinB family protein